MKPCTRIEIVIESPMVPAVLEVLRDIGAPGYTLIPEALGSGDRGSRRADQLAGDSTNSFIVIACDEPDTVDKILESVRPLLSRSGGICLASEAQWLRH